MKVSFISPPHELQKGGIENAIEGLRAALLATGVAVSDELVIDDHELVHHFHGLWNPMHSRIAARLRSNRRPYVVSPHGMLEPWAFQNRRWKKLPYFHLIERRFLMGAASVFVTSSMEKDHLLAVLPHPNVEVLPLGCRDPQMPNYVNSRASLGWSASESVMLYLSRVDPKKGLHLLFDAISSIPEMATSWKLVIVGDGPDDYVTSIKQQQSRLGEKLPTIEWVGAVWGDDRWKYLQAADLFVLPTQSENFGIAVLEALHVGTPVLTTSETPWLDHASMDGIFICEPTIESIRAALKNKVMRRSADWSVGDRELLASWAEARFSWPYLVTDYLTAYERARHVSPTTLK